ncbi:hypothetical protein ASD21_07170 [Caulobacter sp. Root1455]|uniref:ApeA N-terminal domain 1-containing protein n=1 Tax=Caulobacter sp. Root1455 TaxID=1736465 RepID=UPI0006FC6313|nr:hypothetical protein [Caulobacter sp. Root1455]KQY95139.1 hypothetical protein ASD21_07170 [Caulobacter sp. Root1455]
MIKTEDGSKYSGKFAVGDDVLDGELTFSGRDTSLYLHSPEFFRPDANADRCIQGTLHDLTKVSLLECVAYPIPGTANSQTGSYNFTEVKPHFVLHGRELISPASNLIDAVRFIASDALSIFHDHDAFAHAIAPTPAQIRSLVTAYEKVAQRKVKIGDRPEIAFFTGKREIFEAQTAFGTISATNNPRSNIFSGASGVFIRNFVTTDVRFDEPVTFQTALEAAMVILQFLELIAGRRQNVDELFVEMKGGNDHPERLDVYWCNPLARKGHSNERAPQFSDIPVDAVREPEAFAQILTRWLERHETWKVARSRFSASFSEENCYDTDRLICAANMYDLLPGSAVPTDVELPADLILARDQCRTIFRALPDSSERSSVLGTLGRVGKSSLKRKARHRAVPIVEALGQRLPHLNEVIDCAIDCRNFFVHGGDARVDYVGRFFDTVPFLTDTLEFVFGASDLMEAGWDIVAWAKKGTTMSHPFGAYRASYSGHLSALNDALPTDRKLF